MNLLKYFQISLAFLFHLGHYESIETGMGLGPESFTRGTNNAANLAMLFNNLTRSFLCVSMTLALNNLLRRVVAHSDTIVITSGNRMNLTGCNGLGIVVALVEQTNSFFKNLVSSLGVSIACCITTIGE